MEEDFANYAGDADPASITPKAQPITTVVDEEQEKPVEKEVPEEQQTDNEVP